jgi:UTP--glucose-1-phosphate uridylyltransferase
VPSHDGVPVEAVTEDLGHGYGNGTPLLTLRDRLAFHETFDVLDTHPDDPDCLRGIRQRPDPATVSTPLVLVSRLVLRPSVLGLLVPSKRARGEFDLGIAVGELARIADVRVYQITGR